MKPAYILKLVLVLNILIFTSALHTTPTFAKSKKTKTTKKYKAKRKSKPQITKKNKNIEKLAIIGTRVSPRSIGDSSVPLDIISNKDITEQGSKDMTSMLQALVPSFNVNDQPISDEATFVRPANLRGLAPDHTLLLVNGKRRHRSAVISFLGGGLADGSHGPDISSIPGIALKQIEVLRDGASAQYGSDAIAGVINFVLKDSNKGRVAEVQSGVYLKGDGLSFQYATNVGAPLTKNGFVNISLEYQSATATSSSVQRQDAQDLIAAGNTSVANPAQTWGNPELKSDWKLFVNSGIKLNSRSKTYFFGNYSQRTAEGGFFFRNPLTRKGVYVDSNNNKLVTAGGWDFTKKFPGGFTPRFGGHLKDFSLTNGIKGQMSDNYNYDLSVYWGRNWIDYYMRNTVNASLGKNSPTSFKPGLYIQDEKAINLDLNKTFNLGLTEPVAVAMGLEYRQEFYESVAGDLKSYERGPEYTRGFSIGSNGFPGLHPNYAGQSTRNNVAVYLDMETHLVEDFAVGLAFRQEKFSDFGGSTKGKLSGRYQLTDYLAMRSAVSTGFKAPTLGQNTIRKVNTAFNGNALEDRAILPPTDPVSVLKGGKALTPENSVNFSLGLIGELSNNFFITMDYFRIAVKDRISLVSGITVTQADRNELKRNGVINVDSISQISFFSNDFSTTTQGVDVVANYDTNALGHLTQFALAFNWTDTKVKNIRQFKTSSAVAKTNISKAKIRVLETNLPKFRYSLTAKQFYQKWNILTRLNYFSSIFENHLDGVSSTGLSELPIFAGQEYTLDLELGYKYKKNVQLAFGAKNVLNNFPDTNPHSLVAGSKYPVTSPIGINGGFYYARATYSF